MTFRIMDLMVAVSPKNTATKSCTDKHHTPSCTCCSGCEPISDHQTTDSGSEKTMNLELLRRALQQALLFA